MFTSLDAVENLSLSRKAGGAGSRHGALLAAAAEGGRDALVGPQLLGRAAERARRPVSST